MDEARSSRLLADLQQLRGRSPTTRHHRALELFGDIDHQQFDRFFFAVLAVANNHLRFADAQLETFAAQVFDEDAEVHQSAAGDFELFQRVARFDFERHVAAQFFLQPLANLPTGDVLAVAAAERAIIHAEGHLQRGLIDFNRRERHGVVGMGDGVADVDGVHADHGAHVARFHALRFAAVETVECKELRHLLTGHRAGAVDHLHILAIVDVAGEDPANGDPANELRKVDGGDQHLHGVIRPHARRGNFIDNGFEERNHVLLFVAQL